MREALRAGAVLDLFGTAEAIGRHPELLAGTDLAEISARDAAALSETVTPQGLVAVCRLAQPSVEELLASSPRLTVLLVEPSEPGNFGAIVRTADAAGAAAVLHDGGVDPYNGKTVRASAGSIFHLPVIGCGTERLLAGARAAGIGALAATGAGTEALDELAERGSLADPTLWIFGNEARGLPEQVLRAADRTVRVPIFGQAESLNLAATAAVCLYASAREQRRGKVAGPLS